MQDGEHWQRPSSVRPQYLCTGVYGSWRPRDPAWAAGSRWWEDLPVIEMQCSHRPLLEFRNASPAARRSRPQRPCVIDIQIPYIIAGSVSACEPCAFVVASSQRAAYRLPDSMRRLTRARGGWRPRLPPCTAATACNRAQCHTEETGHRGCLNAAEAARAPRADSVLYGSRGPLGRRTSAGCCGGKSAVQGSRTTEKMANGAESGAKAGHRGRRHHVWAGGDERYNSSGWRRGLPWPASLSPSADTCFSFTMLPLPPAAPPC